MSERKNTIRQIGGDLAARVETHLGQEFLEMTTGMAAQFDLGDFENSDPRIRAAKITWGEFTARGGTGPGK